MELTVLATTILRFVQLGIKILEAIAMTLTQLLSPGLTAFTV